MGAVDDVRCSHCGERFPQTKATRKYCSPRCKTNACLARKPSRLRAADVEALHALLDEEVESVQVLRSRLREIVAPGGLRIPRMAEQGFSPPDLD